jgi:class 3 adenylate cyclase
MAGRDPDRILATVLFTDIVEATRTAATLGDRGWPPLLEVHHAVVRRAPARCRGREIDTAGDGFLAAFDGPAHPVRGRHRRRRGPAGPRRARRAPHRRVRGDRRQAP